MSCANACKKCRSWAEEPGSPVTLGSDWKEAPFHRGCKESLGFSSSSPVSLELRGAGGAGTMLLLMNGFLKGGFTWQGRVSQLQGHCFLELPTAPLGLFPL